MATEQFVLIVRAPNRGTEDFSVRCTPDWTVRMLKRLLSKEYPTKPDSQRQKLIYSGKLLGDSEILRDVLHQPEDGAAEPQVVHLVCDPCSQKLPPDTTATTTTTTGASQHAQHTRPSPAAASPSSTPTQQGRAKQGDTATSPSAHGSRVGGSTDTPPLQARGRGDGGADHFMLFQQYNLLNQYAFAGVGQPAGPVGDGDKAKMEGNGLLPTLHPWHAAYMTYLAWTMQQRPTEEASGSHGVRDPLVGEDVQENVQVDNDVGENFAMNAGPGMVPPEQNFRQDWLDHFYSVFCFFLLLSIAWSYASVGKFVFFTLILIAILLYQAGFFALARNRAVRHQHLQEPEEAAELAEPVQEVGMAAQHEQNQEAEGLQEVDEGVAEGEEDTENADRENGARVVNDEADGRGPVPEEAAPEAPVGVAQGEEQPGVFKTLLIFVVSFFTSLVPQRPPEFVGN